MAGSELRALHEILALERLGPTSVFALAGGGGPPHPGLAGWHASSDPAATRRLRGRSAVEWLGSEGSPYEQRYLPTVAAELRRAIREFAADIVVVGPLELCTYLPVAREAAPVVVLDEDVVESVTMRDLASTDPHRARAVLRRHAAERADRAEADALCLVDQVWVCSDHEAEMMRARYPETDVAVVPNGLDVETYPRARRRDPHALVFPARFDYLPNEDAARVLVSEVMPRLSEATLELVGMAPPRWLRDLRDPRVVVTGPVDDVRPYLARAAAMPVPLASGGGTRVKILEAFAAGVPVVSTTKGIEGLDVEDGRHFLCAEGAAAFTVAIERLCDEPELAGALVREAHALVRERFSVTAVASAIRAALERVTLGIATF